MTTAVDEALARLAEKSKALGDQTAEVNALIKRANAALSSTHPGVEVWLDVVKLPDGGIPSTDGDVLLGFRLGYAKLKDQWRLAIRHFFAEDGELGVVALEDGSREVRIHACSLLPVLIDELSRHTDTLIDEISQAIKPRKGQNRP